MFMPIRSSGVFRIGVVTIAPFTWHGIATSTITFIRWHDFITYSRESVCFTNSTVYIGAFRNC